MKSQPGGRDPLQFVVTEIRFPLELEFTPSSIGLHGPYCFRRSHIRAGDIDTELPSFSSLFGAGQTVAGGERRARADTALEIHRDTC
jgi:hypothetical protein